MYFGPQLFILVVWDSLTLLYERTHKNLQNSVTMMNNQENPELLVMENTVSSHISRKTSLSLILSQKQLFKSSRFVKKIEYQILKSSPFHKHLLWKKFQTFHNAVLIINFSHNNQFIASNYKHTLLTQSISSFHKHKIKRLKQINQKNKTVLPFCKSP